MLRGELLSREGGLGIIDVGGVGYAVHAPSRALDTWAREPAGVEVHVSTQVREDAITLYGFPSASERQAFETLMAVSGVGPRLALACLDTLSVEELARAASQGDLATLRRVPGVGKRTAQRMALELEGKLAAFEPTSPARRAASRPADTLELALQRLGYNRTEIDRVIQELPGQGIARDAPVQERLRAALRILYGRQP